MQEKCSHGLAIEKPCSLCVGEQMKTMPAIAHEHEHRDQLSEDVFYPDHPPRTESATFRHTKASGHAAKLPCAVSGHTEGTEYHHIFCEWAYSGAVDWVTVKGVATGTITQLPVLDLDTDQPTGATYPAKDSLLWIVCKLAELRGFDWHAFDPTKPETFVDSMANMLVLHAKFHRHKNHGMHALTFPVWIFQAMPRVPGFVFAADELQHVHEAPAIEQKAAA
jgi:hypothetical protein